MCYPVVSQVLLGGCPKLRWHFKACQNPRVVLENTLWAKSCATPFSEPVTLLNHSAVRKPPVLNKNTWVLVAVLWTSTGICWSGHVWTRQSGEESPADCILDWSEINEKVKILEISKSSQHFETTLPLWFRISFWNCSSLKHFIGICQNVGNINILFCYPHFIQFLLNAES